MIYRHGVVKRGLCIFALFAVLLPYLISAQGDSSQNDEDDLYEPPPADPGPVWDDVRDNVVRNDPNFDLFMAIYDNSNYGAQLRNQRQGTRFIFCFVPDERLFDLHPERSMWENLAESENAPIALHFMQAHHIEFPARARIHNAYSRTRVGFPSKTNQNVVVTRRHNSWILEPISDSGHSVAIDGISLLAPTGQGDSVGDYWGGIPMIVNGAIHDFQRSFSPWPLPGDSESTKLTYLSQHSTSFSILNAFVATVTAREQNYFSWWIKDVIPWYTCLLAPTDSAFLAYRRDRNFWMNLSNNFDRSRDLLEYLNIQYSTLPLWSRKRNTYINRAGKMLSVVDHTLFAIRNPPSDGVFYETGFGYGKFNWYSLKEFHDGWIMPLDSLVVDPAIFETGEVIDTQEALLSVVMQNWMSDSRYSKMKTLIEIGNFLPTIQSAKASVLGGGSKFVLFWPLDDHIEAIANSYGGWDNLLTPAGDSKRQEFLSDHIGWAYEDLSDYRSGNTTLSFTSSKDPLVDRNLLKSRPPSDQSSDVMEYILYATAGEIRISFKSGGVETFIFPDGPPSATEISDSSYTRNKYQRGYAIPFEEIISWDEGKGYIIPLIWRNADDTSFNGNGVLKPASVGPSNLISGDSLGPGMVFPPDGDATPPGGTVLSSGEAAATS